MFSNRYIFTTWPTNLRWFIEVYHMYVYKMIQIRTMFRFGNMFIKIGIPFGLCKAQFILVLPNLLLGDYTISLCRNRLFLGHWCTLQTFICCWKTVSDILLLNSPTFSFARLIANLVMYRSMNNTFLASLSTELMALGSQHPKLESMFNSWCLIQLVSGVKERKSFL